MRVGIVGLGLIGGSLGLALRSTGTDTVLGVSRRSQVCQQAIAIGAVDEASTNLNLLATADVIVLCTPIAAIEPTVKLLLPFLNPATVLTDVGSVKASIVESIAKRSPEGIAPLWPNFVGGHPMAGKAESGLDLAEANLFVQKPYVITPIDSTPAEAIAIVTSLVKAIQADLYQCDPQAHDRAVAWISHLPVMVSASLICACLNEPDDSIRDLAEKLASSGFRDTSRVGGGVPDLGVMMARYNQVALRQALSGYRDRLDELIELIDRSDWPALEAVLQQTQAGRSRFL